MENDALFNLLINNCDNQYALPNKMIKVVVGFNNFTLVFMEFIDPTLTIIGMHFLHLSTLHWLRKIIIGYIEEPSYPSHITFFHIHEIVLQGLHQNIHFYKQTFIIIILRISIFGSWKMVAPLSISIYLIHSLEIMIINMHYAIR